MKVIAYQVIDTPMILKPAKKEREWMDNSSNKYAYRCLPLSIANSTGWDIYPIDDFIIGYQNVNPDHQSSLFCSYNEKYDKFVDSVFGCGIFTLHPGYLFRTEPGWDMLVTGVPNQQPDWAFPLTGIVETSWLDFTFTMNWKMLQFGTYLWKKEMPICRIIPIPHDYSNIEAEIKLISDNKELEEQYLNNAASRQKHIQSLAKTFEYQQDIDNIKLNKPSTHWQKTYYRGYDGEGKKQEDHVVRRSFPEFKRT